MEKVWCPCDHRMSTFGCARNTGFLKTQKNNDNLKYLINSTSFPFLIWYILVPPLEGNSHSYNRSIFVFAGATVLY